MKRMSIILMACLMVLGLSQCKKESQNTSAEPEGVKITLTVDNGGERVTVTPGESVSSVTFDNGDVILVANGGHFVGSLTRINGAFTGTITANLTTSDKLHFFFVGNKVSPSTLKEGASTGCTVDMSDQSEGPAVVSYASMAYDGSSSVTANARLLNKASGLVKFTTNEGTTNDITISGVYNKINITFSAEPTIAPDQTERGTIKLCRYTGDTENKTFLAVIPVQNGVDNVSVSVDGFTAENIEIPAVEENTNGTNVEIEMTAASSVPTGAISGVFTINDHGGKVYFSQGNLQYNKSTGVWSFMEHQYDMVEANDQDVGEDYANQNIVSLFGWGAWTSGQNPWETDPDAVYQYSTEPTVCNQTNWRALTSAEWQYLFSKHNYGEHKVCGVNGLLVLPDGVDSATGFVNGMDGSWNEVSNGDWAAMEAAGAVFLPAAGSRFDTDVYGVGEWGNYWSSTYYYEGDSKAYNLFFEEEILNATESGAELPNGQSVRLVQDKAN